MHFPYWFLCDLHCCYAYTQYNIFNSFGKNTNKIPEFSACQKTFKNPLGSGDKRSLTFMLQLWDLIFISTLRLGKLSRALENVYLIKRDL